ncbi:unnamed protein product [Calypogeia fissa]
MRSRTPPVKVPAALQHQQNGTVADEVTEREREKEKTSLLGLRKKGLGVRAWLVIDPSGRAQLVEAGKHVIMRRAQLPARDLRILDPLLSYPSTILGRERAIVVNLEHIKAIITAQEVLLLNSKDPAVAPIVLDLQRRLPLHYNSLGQQVPGDGGGGLSDNEDNGVGRPLHNTPASGIRSREGSRTNLQKLGQGLPDSQVPPVNAPTPALQSRAMDFKIAGASPSQATGGPNVLPFEFRALEVCLEAACSCLDTETTRLEREAYPALDELTSKLSTLNLERVRQIKSRLVAISGRVQKVRDEIEQLLDDDGDMAEMYLTDKLLRAQMEGSVSPKSSHGRSNPMSPSRLESSEGPMEETAEMNKMMSSEQFTIHESEDDNDRSQRGPSREISGQMEDLLDPSESFAGVRKVDNRSSTTSSTNSSHEKLDVEELEMLLEAYFVQIEGTINKLSALRDYVDDTEDYINIMLDDKQNHLLQMGVLLTTATLVVSAFIVVTGIFGMNISISLFSSETTKTSTFNWVVGGSVVGCVVLYVSAVAWCKYKRLIE